MKKQTFGFYKPPTLRERIKYRLFPSRSLPVPQPGDLKWGIKGYLVTNTTVHLDWVDRIRTLISGRLRVNTITHTDVLVSETLSQTVTYVLPPWEKK